MQTFLVTGDWITPILFLDASLRFSKMFQIIQYDSVDLFSLSSTLEYFSWLILSSVDMKNGLIGLMGRPRDFDIVFKWRELIKIWIKGGTKKLKGGRELLAFADKLCECIWPFCGVGAERVKRSLKKFKRSLIAKDPWRCLYNPSKLFVFCCDDHTKDFRTFSDLYILISLKIYHL